MRGDIAEFDVVKVAGVYTVPPTRAIRSRTKRAAGRLAAYQLRRFVRGAQMRVVSDVMLSTDLDHYWTTGSLRVTASARATKAPVPDGYRIPEHVAVFRVPLPDVAGES